MNLKSSVEENKARSGKIAREKDILEFQTSKGSESLMDQRIFKSIVMKITETRNLYDKTRARAQNQQIDPTTQLREIEGHINRVLKFLKLAKIADDPVVNSKMGILRADAKTRLKDALLLQQEHEA